MNYKLKKIIILFVEILIIIILLYFFTKLSENFTSDKKYDCIISINVHENFEFLLEQINNIKKKVKCKHAIILNCNDFMFNECKNNTLPEDVYVHDIILNKRRFHGSLTEGIYNNICYSIDNFDFKYFIVASSRNLFKNDMKLDVLNKLVTIGKPYTENIPYTEWWWPVFMNTKLAKYYIENNQELYNSPHEGLLLTKKSCIKIKSFLENNIEIKEDLFNFDGCVEEFALQTISMNSGENIYYIGNGVEENEIKENTSEEEMYIFMYKVGRNIQSIIDKFSNFFG